MSKKMNKYAGGQPGAAYDPTGIGQYLGLGRPIDFEQKDNKRMMLATLAITVAGTLWKFSTGMGSADAVTVALGYGLGFLFCCLLAEELDPDRGVEGGLIGGVLTLVAYYFFGEGNVLILFWLLFILRMLNRSSGDRHRLLDNVIMIGSAAWLGLGGYWMFPLLTGAAYILESQIQNGYFRSLYLAGISLACLLFAKYDVIANILSMSNIIIMAIAFILFLPEIRCADYVQAKGDINRKRLLPKRLQTMQGYFIMMLFTLTFMHGNAIIPSLMPAVAAAAGCGIRLMIALVRHEVDFHKH